MDEYAGIRERMANLRALQALRAAGVPSPTWRDVYDLRRVERAAEFAAYVQSKSTFPAPVAVETLEQNESRARAEWLQRNEVDSDYDGSISRTVQRVKAATAEKRRARTLAERKARVDNFEASLRGSNA